MTDSEELLSARRMIEDYAPDADPADKELAAKRLAATLSDTYWKGRFRSRPVAAIHASGASSILSNYVELIPDFDE